MKAVYLGQFTDEVANAIAEELEGAGIGWSYKQPGFLTRIFFMGEWGTRMFVDDEHVDAARTIAERITGQMKEET